MGIIRYADIIRHVGIVRHAGIIRQSTPPVRPLFWSRQGFRHRSLFCLLLYRYPGILSMPIRRIDSEHEDGPILFNRESVPMSNHKMRFVGFALIFAIIVIPAAVKAP